MWAFFDDSVRRLSDRVRSMGFLASNVLAPLGVLSLYLVSFAVLLPPGLNQTFVSRTARALVPTTLLLWAVFWAATRIGAIRTLFSRGAEERLSPSDSILLLLPLAPVTQYILLNVGILSLLDSILVLGFFALLSFLLVLALPGLLRRTGFMLLHWSTIMSYG